MGSRRLYAHPDQHGQATSKVRNRRVSLSVARALLSARAGTESLKVSSEGVRQQPTTRSCAEDRPLTPRVSRNQIRQLPLAQSEFTCYKQCTESSVWLAGQFLQLS